MEQEKPKFKLPISDWTNLSLRIMALAFTAMLVSYSPDYLREFFADTARAKDDWHRGMFDGMWEWGFRHYIFFWMNVALLGVQIARLITWVGHDKRDFKP